MVKPKRRKRSHPSCMFCKRSHVTCDGERPCSRCVSRKISVLCVKSDNDRVSESPSVNNNDTNMHDDNFNKSSINSGNVNNNLIPAGHGMQTNGGFDALPSDMSNFEIQDSNLSANYLFKFLPTNQFASENAGSEFSSLNDFLNMLEDPIFLNDSNFQNIDNTTNYESNEIGISRSINAEIGPSNKEPVNQSTTSVSNSASNQNPRRSQKNTEEYRYPVGVTKFRFHSGVDLDSSPNSNYNKNKATVNRRLGVNNTPNEHFFLTAADPVAEVSPEEKLRLVINAKMEAGLLKPYDYAAGYKRLQLYMDRYMNQESKLRILKPLSIIRPAFRAIAKSLKDMDLILIEERFERMLLSYDRVFTSMSIPACLWRRTGEIYRGNKEFASLVGCTVDQLREGNLAIYELMSEESAVNFWEKYGAIAFDKSQKAVLTSCNLRTLDTRKKRSCCFSFTIRRDMYNMPTCIIGNFIPVSP
ncbi:hypothetical protein TPHA_0F03260 [Tetrapisispora phaffii CBS 4417]|uniref:Zn(2)-C6 fungal-type domain-containing protein n=1 Tax=Tetrapisispora phaffii (strain ATCC 24235 / CBS 4417 / NBRC 1672 / NRRL Y-8282 / UCD 70-5) TaxID=1071381 RepID=G8BUM1_TETPH|nr:hypothetical protein TPHA_0F03260 [Tetrapisispora phaffii CBS 4417]CCE63807.1 hypothetical protein TPHA_0F03260 [Tetrapisispora phaffii CBS 4417]